MIVLDRDGLDGALPLPEGESSLTLANATPAPRRARLTPPLAFTPPVVTTPLAPATELTAPTSILSPTAAASAPTARSAPATELTVPTSILSPAAAAPAQLAGPPPATEPTAPILSPATVPTSSSAVTESPARPSILSPAAAGLTPPSSATPATAAALPSPPPSPALEAAPLLPLGRQVPPAHPAPETRAAPDTAELAAWSLAVPLAEVPAAGLPWRRRAVYLAALLPLVVFAAWLKRDPRGASPLPATIVQTTPAHAVWRSPKTPQAPAVPPADAPAAPQDPTALPVAAAAPQASAALAVATVPARPPAALAGATAPARAPAAPPVDAPAAASPQVLPVDFAFNAVRPLDRGAALLELVRAAAARCAGTLVLTGHADRIGSPRVNEAIGRARAQALRELLVAEGVEAARLRVASAGARQPIAPNDNAAGRAENRRVTLYCSPKLGGEL